MPHETLIRAPAFAGSFYPNNANELRRMLQKFLCETPKTAAPIPKAIIAPHAGYIYSGAVAATAYARLSVARDLIKRVVLLGPSHRVPFKGLAASHATHFVTPLGKIVVDRQAIEQLGSQITLSDQAHALEHSLEVHLPFLQEILADFTLIPLIVGEATPTQVGKVLEQLWGSEETLIVISSDLSHYHDYETAQLVDKRTSQAIEELRFQDIHYEQACGRNPINGLLHEARRRGMQARTIDLRNSGDTAGSKAQVVGYGAYVFN
jgi:hypothetical protein